jgi:hypothetical protein
VTVPEVASTTRATWGTVVGSLEMY